MKLKAFSLTLFLTSVLFFSSCKKEGADQSFADKLVGNYLVKDTLSSASGCDGGPAGDIVFDAYGIVVTKKDDNTVTVSSFHRCGGGAFDASVTETSLIALEGNPCGNVYNVVGIVSGNQLRFTYKFYGVCEFDSRATATKQQ